MGARQWLAAGCILLAMGGCGGGDNGAGGSAGSPDSGVVGAAGGTVRGPDGATIELPAGALVNGTTVTLAKDATGAPALPSTLPALGAIFAATPHGVPFGLPARIRVPFDPRLLGAAGRARLLTAEPGGPWVLLADAELDGDALVTQVSMFSFYTVVDCTGSPCTDLQMAMTPSLDLAAEDPDRAGTHTAPAKVTVRAPRYLPVRLDFTSPPGAGSLFTFKLYLTNRAGRREAASGVLNGTTITLDVPIWESDNGLQQLSVEITCQKTMAYGGKSCEPVAQSFFDQFHYINAFTARINGPTFEVAIPAGTPVATALPLVTEEPADVQVAPGATRVTFAAAVAQPHVRHSWEVSKDGGTNWTDLGSYPITIFNCNVLGVDCSHRTTAEAQLRTVFDLSLWYWDPSSGWNWTWSSNTLAPITEQMNGVLVRARLTNDFGSVTTRAALVTVAAPVSVAPVIRTQPQATSVVAGQGSSFTVSADGSPAPAFQWQWLAPGASAWTSVGTSAPFLNLEAALTLDGARVRVNVSNAAGSVTSDTVSITVTELPVAPGVIAQPQPMTVAVGHTALFAASVTGSTPLSYQWLRDGIAIAGANSPVLRLDAVTPAASGSSYRLRVSNAVGQVESASATLTVTADVAITAPQIVAQPAALTVSQGQAASLAVGVSGTGPLTFQWLREGVPLAGATAAVLTLPTVTPADAGSYRVVVSNAVGGTTSESATLSVTAAAPPVAPAITTQPHGLVVLPLGSATLAVAASGTAPLAYQWQRDGVDVAGATTAVLQIDAVTLASAGSYTVVVSNAAGRAVSGAAAVLLAGAPGIQAQPTNATVLAGSVASFSVGAVGDGLHYQWTRNGAPIDGAIAATYTTATLSSADNGAVFGVLVYNGAGLLFSRGAVLTVLPTDSAYEGFAYPLNDRLAGKTGGTGWGGAWEVADGNTGAALDASLSGTIVAGLEYTDASGKQLLTSGGAWQTDATIGSNVGALARRLTGASFGAPGTTGWVSLLVKQASVATTPNIAAVTLGTDARLGLAGPAMAGITDDLSPFIGCLFCRSSNGAIPGYGPGVVVMMLVRIDFGATGDFDTMSLWINPPLDPAVPLGPPTLAGFGLFADSLSGLSLLHGTLRSFTFDELRIAPTREGVSPMR